MEAHGGHRVFCLRHPISSGISVLCDKKNDALVTYVVFQTLVLHNQQMDVGVKAL